MNGLALAGARRLLGAKALRRAMMHALEFGTTGFYPAFEGANRAKLAQEMGFDIQGFSENHSGAPDCFGEMRDAAPVTTRIKLACGPVNFLTRNPGVIAAA